MYKPQAAQNRFPTLIREREGKFRMKTSKSLFLGLALLLATSAFAANKGSLTVQEPMTVNGTQLKPGDYKVEWDGNGPSVELSITQGKKVIAKVPAHVVNLDTFEDDERTGARIVLRALEEPLRQIAENSGLEGSVVVNDVRKAKKGHGLNAATGEIVDLIAAGIIDPAMVTRSALQNAASIAKNILTTEAIVAEVPEKDGGGGPGGGMPDMSGIM